MEGWSSGCLLLADLSLGVEVVSSGVVVSLLFDGLESVALDGEVEFGDRGSRNLA